MKMTHNFKEEEMITPTPTSRINFNNTKKRFKVLKMQIKEKIQNQLEKLKEEKMEGYMELTFLKLINSIIKQMKIIQLISSILMKTCIIKNL